MKKHCEGCGIQVDTIVDELECPLKCGNTMADGPLPQGAPRLHADPPKPARRYLGASGMMGHGEVILRTMAQGTLTPAPQRTVVANEPQRKSAAKGGKRARKHSNYRCIPTDRIRNASNAWEAYKLL